MSRIAILYKNNKLNAKFKFEILTDYFLKN